MAYKRMAEDQFLPGQGSNIAQMIERESAQRNERLRSSAEEQRRGYEPGIRALAKLPEEGYQAYVQGQKRAEDEKDREQQRLDRAQERELRGTQLRRENLGLEGEQELADFERGIDEKTGKTHRISRRLAADQAEDAQRNREEEAHKTGTKLTEAQISESQSRLGMDRDAYQTAKVDKNIAKVAEIQALAQSSTDPVQQSIYQKQADALAAKYGLDSTQQTLVNAESQKIIANRETADMIGPHYQPAANRYAKIEHQADILKDLKVDYDQYASNERIANDPVEARAAQRKFAEGLKEAGYPDEADQVINGWDIGNLEKTKTIMANAMRSVVNKMQRDVKQADTASGRLATKPAFVAQKNLVSILAKDIGSIGNENGSNLDRHDPFTGQPVGGRTSNAGFLQKQSPSDMPVAGAPSGMQLTAAPAPQPAPAKQSGPIPGPGQQQATKQAQQTPQIPQGMTVDLWQLKDPDELPPAGATLK